MKRDAMPPVGRESMPPEARLAYCNGRKARRANGDWMAFHNNNPHPMREGYSLERIGWFDGWLDEHYLKWHGDE